MYIHIAHGAQVGDTQIAAFDAALWQAGVANYNLLRLSSVVPPGSEIVVHGTGIPHGTLSGTWGDRLYVVMAEARTSSPGQTVWAGIGWVQERTSGRGLFVEHEGDDEGQVRVEITRSLSALMATRQVDFGPVHMDVAGASCVDRPVCALTVAVYQSEPW